MINKHSIEKENDMKALKKIQEINHQDIRENSITYIDKIERETRITAIEVATQKLKYN